MKFIAFTGVQGLGQTFMEWSFHYLIGKSTYWNADHGIIPLIDDPTKEVIDGYGNAHAHQRNSPLDIKSLEEFITKANDQKGSDIITCYPHLDGFKFGDSFLEQYDMMINCMKDHDFIIFEVNLTKPYPFLTERTSKDEIESIRSMCKILNKSSVDIDPTDIKTLRETLSFKILKNRKDWQESLRPFYARNNPRVDLFLTDEEWRTDTADCIRKIIEYCDLSIDNQRFQKWLPIMEKWQVPHRKMINRYENDIPLIIEHIIKNKDLDLRSFNLGMLDQVLIMAYLMKDHGRRLILTSKDFPNNTKDLHLLLK